jgi:uncharacterized SAM-binding protein YcdF (DUF218 family)
MAQDKQRRWRRSLGKILAGLLVLIVAVGAVAWIFPHQLLTVDSGPAKADAMVLIGGAWLERPKRAAELFKQKEAPKVLVSGKGECDFDKRMLETNGVPAAAILLECQSRTTRENAEFSIPMLRAMGAKRVIIVTSWYHSRRALACFEHFAPDITFYSRPSYFAWLRGEWRRDRIEIKTEYLKLLGYWMCYGVCPL